MNFKFNVTTTTTTEGKKDKVLVDWNALNEHVVEAAGTAKKARSVPGVISGIYDLGEQNLEDAKVVFTGTAEDEAAEIAARPGTYFEDGLDDKGKPARLKRWPQKPVQQVAVTIDFPQIMVDKGQFFGKSDPKPLRMLLNGEFTLPGEKLKVVAKPYNIRETKYDAEKTWAFAKNNTLHKLADAVGILDDNGLFKKERIGELLGKVAQFQFQVWMKPGNKKAHDGSVMTFFTEDIKLVGMVPEGVPLPEVPEGILHGVNLYGENDPAAVKQLRVAVKNTIKRANNYEGSDLQKFFEADGEQSQPKAETPKADVQPVAPKVQVDDFEDDIPF